MKNLHFVAGVLLLLAGIVVSVACRGASEPTRIAKGQP